MRATAMKALALGVLLSSLASAANFSFQGSFSQDDQVQLFTFTVASTSTVTMRTWSYAGGINAAGVTIARGGFDPTLTLFNSAGVFLGQRDDGGSVTAADPVTGQNFDSYYQTSLLAGIYTVALTQYDNVANGLNLSDGFANTGRPTFTSAFLCSNGKFCDATGDNRTGQWAFDILGASSAAQSGAPEPTAFSTIGGALLVAAVLAKRTRILARFKQSGASSLT